MNDGERRPIHENPPIEVPISTKRARELLGCGATRVSAIKKAMGLTGNYVFLSKVVEWLKQNPNFSTDDAYPRVRVRPARPSQPSAVTNRPQAN
jgi:hypothetical protein